jgi:hypothetical protein
MKKVINILVLLLINFVVAQNVILNKVVKTGTNAEKFFYRINPDSVKSQYLGEIEVQGFSTDDTAVFNLIYKKAKSIGADAFSYKPFDTIEGAHNKLDPSHYLLNLYEVRKADFPDETTKLYVISSSLKSQRIIINAQLLELPTRTFVLKKLIPGEVYTISTRKLFGSSVKIISDKYDNGQYFQISGFKINSNSYGKAGINIKSGDILKLEKSFGDFLTTIYTEIK